MKKVLFALIVLVLGVLSASAQDAEPLFMKNKTVPQIVGVDFQYPLQDTKIKMTSKDGVDYLINASYCANVFYERGSLFRLKFEAGATMVQGPDNDNINRTLPAVGGAVMVGYPFLGIQQRTYILGYIGIGGAVAPGFGLLGKALFEIKLSHYVTNTIALNAMARMNAYANRDGKMPFSIGAGISYQL